MGSENRDLEAAQDIKTLFDLPPLDIIVAHIGKYLRFQDILNFRLCSLDCKAMGDKMLVKCTKIDIRLRLIIVRPDQIFHERQEEIFEVLNNKCRKLKKLDLEVDHWHQMYDASKNTLFPLISQKCRRLRFFKAERALHLTVELFSEILQNNPLLEDIRIRGWIPKLQNSGGNYPIVVNCKNLVRFDMTYCNHDFLKYIDLQNSSLLEVNFTRTRCILPQNLIEFFKKQPHLQAITLTHYDLFSIQPILITIAKVCRHLEFLDIWSSQIIDNHVIMRLVYGCPKIKGIRMTKTCCNHLPRRTIDYLKCKNIDLYYN